MAVFLNSLVGRFTKKPEKCLYIFVISDYLEQEL